MHLLFKEARKLSRYNRILVVVNSRLIRLVGTMNKNTQLGKILQ